eukprot:snap_masked-scaffold_16-processed-gene-2.34-mRNA-1 protein AED:0.07 eAED:0.07 QI:0/-1/0/1/-1/1/1/0/664
MAKKKNAKKEEAKAKKRLKQQNKALKKNSKRNKGKFNYEEEPDDLDALLKEFEKRDQVRDQVQVAALDKPPTPRNYSTITDIGDNIFLIFGGEYFDGEVSKCFNNLYKFTPSKNEWKEIISPNPPPRRCSHQAISATVGGKQKIYIFGGEFSTANSFHHYRDLWEFDVETNTFNNIITNSGPSARSGHRMGKFKHFLVLFGGFYETAKGTNFYNDIHLFDLRAKQWFQPLNDSKKGTKLVQKPSPRSAFHFHASKVDKDSFFMFGGYSKEKGKGKSLCDMWKLELCLLEPGSQKVDISWTRVSAKGSLEAMKRSGSGSVVYKNRIILFGGVVDKQSENDVEGEFYSDLFSFDMGRCRWYEVDVSKKLEGKKRRRRKKKAEMSQQKIEEMETDDESIDDNAFYYVENGEIIKLITEEEGEKPEMVEGDFDVKKMDKEEIKIEKKEEEMEDVPMGRIGAGIFCVGNLMYILFGTSEIVDYHVNFDDMWRLNIAKPNGWENVVCGDWKSTLDKVQQEADLMEVEGGEDLMTEEEGDSSDGESGSSLEENGMNLKEVLELREVLEKYSQEEIPEFGEELRDFFERTVDFWVSEFASKLLEPTARLSGKELRREGFQLCQKRYEEVKMTVEKLGTLELEQTQRERDLERQGKISELRKRGVALKSVKTR